MISEKNEKFLEFFECSFPLTQWACGTDLMSDILAQVEACVSSIKQLSHWKSEFLLYPKPTLSSKQILVFWVHKSIIDAALHLPGVRGGFSVFKKPVSLPDSSTYGGKKQSPRPRRVLLDIGVDTSELIRHLHQLGLEVEQVWTHAADLLHYEIIELCTSQFIDLLVTTNPRLLMPPEEWLDYLMPHRTRIIVIPETSLNSTELLAKDIHQRAYKKRKFKTRTNQYSNLLTENKLISLLEDKKE